MKKFILLILFLFLILFTYSFKPIFLDIYSVPNLMFSDAEYSFYCMDLSDEIKNLSISHQHLTLISGGNNYIVKTNISMAKNIKNSLSFVMGESIRFKSTKLAVEKLIDYFDLKIVKTENIAGILSIIGYSENSNLIHKTCVENLPVNVQIAYSNGTITIGSPIILGDY